MKKAKKIRSYLDYTLTALQEICGIDNTRQNLVLCQTLIPPSELLQQILHRNKIVPVNCTNL